MKNKKIVTLLVSALIGGLAIIPVGNHSTSINKKANNKVLLAAQSSWAQYGNTWYYNIGNKPVTGWQEINGTWYYFASNGVMQRGWVQTNGSLHYMNESGALSYGWFRVNGNWYYSNLEGQMQTGWLYTNDSWHYMNTQGIMQTGLREINGSKYYFDNNGIMQTGWQDINGAWYFFNNSGVMQTGWSFIYGKWYNFDSQGAMNTGWVHTDGSWQFLNGSGVMQTGWYQVNNKWYYSNESGAMQTGWLLTNASLHYLNSSGAMLTGWNQINGCWYYFNNSGIELTGWQQVGNEWYFIGRTGRVTGWNEIYGKMYYFNEQGVYQKTLNNKAYDNVNYNMTMDKYVAGEVKEYLACVGETNLSKEQMSQLKTKIANAVNPADAKDMYQFLNVGHYRNVSVAELNKMLQGKGVFSGQGQAFADAAKEYNIDPIYFVAQSILETGWGRSNFAEGITITKTYTVSDNNVVTLDKTLAKPVKVYNLFGIGAFDQAPTKGGTSYAYNHGWTTVPKAIFGAAKFLSTAYVHNSNIPQNTPYQLRYINGTIGQMWHQYSSDITYASQIGSIMNQLSGAYSANNIFTFEIPKFENTKTDTNTNTNDINGTN